MPVDKEDVPDTIERSPEKVRATYEKTLDSAHEQYDSEERAHRTAWAAVKRTTPSVFAARPCASVAPPAAVRASARSAS